MIYLFLFACEAEKSTGFGVPSGGASNPDTYFDEILEYMGLEKSEFFEIADRWRSPHLWKRTNEKWVLRHEISNE